VNPLLSQPICKNVYQIKYTLTQLNLHNLSETSLNSTRKKDPKHGRGILVTTNKYRLKYSIDLLETKKKITNRFNST